MENKKSPTQEELLDAYLKSFYSNKICFTPLHFSCVDRNFLSRIADNIAKGCTVCNQQHNKEFEDAFYNAFRKNSE